MAKKATAPQRIDMKTAELYVLNDQAYIGTIVHKERDGRDSQYLIISNTHGDIIDVQTLGENATVKADKPVLVLGSNSDTSSKIPSGYYAGGASMILDNHGANASDDAFYSVDFANQTGYALSAFERTRAYERALDLLDTTNKIGTNVNEYLQTAVSIYSQEANAYRMEDTHVYPNDKYGSALRQQDTASAMMDQSSAFVSRVRDASIGYYLDSANERVNGLNERVNSGYSSEIERSNALHDLQLATMKTNYFETSRDLVREFRDDLVRDGLVEQVGVGSELSLHKINQAISENQSQIQAYVRSGESPELITHRIEYVTKLTELAEQHPYMIESAHSDKGQYHFMADQSIYASTQTSIGAHGRAIDQASQHSMPTYGDMSQREFVDYMSDRSRVIAIVQQYDAELTGLYNQTHVSEQFKSYYPESYHVGDPITLSERRDAVMRFIEEKLPGNEYEHKFAREYMQSAEFATIAADHDALYIKDAKGQDLGFNSKGELISASSEVLRPEFEVKWHTYDLSDPAKCADLQKALNAASLHDRYLNERPSLELAAGREFISDYITFNQNIQSSEYNYILSNKLSEPRVEYGSGTLSYLNDTNYLRSEEAIKFLNDCGYSVDFHSAPTAQKMHENYYALQYGMAEIREAKMEHIQDVLSELKHVQVDETATPDWSRVMSLIESVKEMDDERKKSEEILAVFAMKHEGDLSAKEIAMISSVLNDAEIHDFERIERIGITSRELAEQLNEDLNRSATLVTRGTDDLYIRLDNGAFDIEEKDPAAKYLDFATALAANYTAETVLRAHELRNEMIDTMESQLSTPELRRDLYERLAGIKDVINAEPSEERTLKIAEAWQIDMSMKESDPDTYAIKLALLQRAEFESSFKQAFEFQSHEHMDATHSKFVLDLQKTGGLEELRYIIDHQSQLDMKLDYSKLGNKEYLQFLADRQSEMGHDEMASKLNTVIESNKYCDVLIIARNVEELTHRADMSDAERNITLTLAKNLAFASAVSDSTEYIGIRTAQYEALIDAAADKGNESNYMKEKIAETRLQLIGATESLESHMQQSHPVVEGRISNSIQLTTDDTPTITGHNRFQGAVIDPDKLYEMRAELERDIKQNRFFEEYTAANGNTEKHIELEKVRYEIERSEELLASVRVMKADYEERAHGIIGHLKYGQYVEASENQIQTLLIKIDELEKQEQSLIVSIRDGVGKVDENIESSYNAYQKLHTNESAQVFVSDVIREYGTDSAVRTAETRNALLDTYSPIELCEAMRSVDPPLAIKGAYYEAALATTDHIVDNCVERANQMKEERMYELRHEVNPADATLVTPEVVQTAIDKLQVQYDNTTDAADRMSTQSKIDRLVEIRDELTELGKLEITKETIPEAVAVLGVHDKRAIEVERDYTIANETREAIQENKVELERLNSSLNAYRDLEQVRELSSTLSLEERTIAANAMFTHENTATADKIAETVNAAVSKNEETHTFENPEAVQAFMKEFEALHKQQQNINITLDHFEQNYSIDPHNSSDMSGIQAIGRYNEALASLSEHDREAIVNVVMNNFTTSDTAANRELVQSFVAEPITTGEVDKFIEQNHEAIFGKQELSIVNEYGKLTEEQKTDLVQKVYLTANINGENELSSMEVQLATMAVAENGINHYPSPDGTNTIPSTFSGDFERNLSTMAFSESEASRDAFKFCEDKITADDAKVGDVERSAAAHVAEAMAHEDERELADPGLENA